MVYDLTWAVAVHYITEILISTAVFSPHMKNTTKSISVILIYIQ